jgi:hypothetical protein
MFDEGDRVMGGEPRPGWRMTAVHWGQEELIVEYRWGVGADAARALVAQALASGRVPSLGGHRGGTDWHRRSILSRMWIGVLGRPDGCYMVAILGSRCLVGRLTARPPEHGL